MHEGQEVACCSLNEGWVWLQVRLECGWPLPLARSQVSQICARPDWPLGISFMHICLVFPD
jgi:hypothetical protein